MTSGRLRKFPEERIPNDPPRPAGSYIAADGGRLLELTTIKVRSTNASVQNGQRLMVQSRLVPFSRRLKEFAKKTENIKYKKLTPFLVHSLSTIRPDPFIVSLNV